MFCCLTGSIHVLQRDQDQVPAAGHHHPQVDGLHLHGGPLHQEAPRQVYKNALSLHNATSSLKQLAICARELKKRSAKGSNYKEDDRALPLYVLLFYGQMGRAKFANIYWFFIVFYSFFYIYSPARPRVLIHYLYSYTV